MRSTGAEVVKIAADIKSLSDCVPLLDLGAQAGRQAGLVVIGMGDFGLVTRVLARRFGSMWTYAGAERHVGQVSAATLLHDYRFRTLGDSTDIYGLVGLPVSHSVSPAMHNAAFAAARLDAVYLPLPAVSAEDFVTFGRAHRHQGREHHDAAQGVALRVRGRGLCRGAPHRRHQHDSRHRRPMGGREHGRRRVSGAADATGAARRQAARLGAGRRRRRARGGRGARVERLQSAHSRAQSETGRRGGDAGVGRGRPVSRRSRAAGTSWSTARRSGCIRAWTTRRSTRASSRAGTSTTSSTTRRRRG